MPQTENPYLAPTSKIEGAESGEHRNKSHAGRSGPVKGYAGKSRIFALYIDGFITGFVTLGISATIPGLSDFMRGSLFFALFLCYHTITEALWQKTLGKKLCGLELVSSRDEPVGWRVAFIRSLVRLIDANPLIGALPGGIVVMIDKRNRRLGDIVAGTLVVRSQRP